MPGRKRQGFLSGVDIIGEGLVMADVLWGVPPYEGWTGGAIRIESGSREAYDRRKREGWTHLRIWPEGEQGITAQGCAVCYAAPGGKHLKTCNGSTLAGEMGE